MRAAGTIFCTPHFSDESYAPVFEHRQQTSTKTEESIVDHNSCSYIIPIYDVIIIICFHTNNQSQVYATALFCTQQCEHFITIDSGSNMKLGINVIKVNAV